MLLRWDFELVFIMMEIPNHPPRTILLLSAKKKRRRESFSKIKKISKLVSNRRHGRKKDLDLPTSILAFQYYKLY